MVGRGAALAAGAAGLGGLIVGFKGVYTEARQAQKVGAQTAAVIKSTGGVAKVSAVHVSALATAISNKVGVDDEAIQSGQNLLLTFTGIRNEAGKGNKIFDMASRAIVDMTAAMNGGVVSQEGLKASAIQVGKALQDPIKGTTALRKVGVALTEQQVKQIKTLVEHGHKLEAQKIILGELNKEFGGSAAAGTNAMQKLGVVFDNIKESVGTALLPVIDKLATWLAQRLPGALATATRWFGNIEGGIKGLFDLLVRGDFTTAFGKAFHVSEDSPIVDVLLKIRTGILDTATWIKTMGVPAIGRAFGAVDLSGIAKAFTAQATTWGTALINGVKQGLNTGDWSGLGETVGKGLVAAIEGAGRLVKLIASKISELFAKVDWVGIGLTIGKQVPSLLAGLALGILNFDLGGLLKGLWQHWQEVLLGILALAFTPVKIIGKVGELLARIPLVGKLLEWALTHMAAFSRGLVKAVGDALGFLGKAFLEGFRTVFPRVGAAFSSWLSLLPTRVGVAALDVAAAAGRMVRGLGRAIAGGVHWVVSNIGQLIAQMLKPWANAAGWLVRRGVEFVSGVIGGIRSYLSLAAAAARRVITTIVSPFATAGRWLVGAGQAVIRGLWSGISAAWAGVAHWFASMGARIGGWFARAGGWLWGAGNAIIGGIWAGIRSAMGGVGRILGEVKDAIVGGLKRLFHISSPSRLMMGIGGNIITGLIKGLLTSSGALARTVKDIGGTVLGIFGNIAGDIGGRVLGGVPTGTTAMQSMVKGYASMLYGWTGEQWRSLYALIMGESGFNPNAQNPTSTAYGLFQFLDSTWAGVNASKTSNPQMQTLAGLRYIKQVYGDPANAYGKWLSRSPHWYGSGLPPTVFNRPTVIGVGERGAETVSVTPGRASGSGGNDDLVAEIRALRVDIRASQRQTALTLASHLGSGRR